MTPSGSFRSCVATCSPSSRCVTSTSSFTGMRSGRQRTGTRAVDDAEDAALRDARGLAGREERDIDVDGLVELHLDEVDVLERARDGVVREVADHREELLAPSSVELDDACSSRARSSGSRRLPSGGTAMGVDGKPLPYATAGRARSGGGDGLRSCRRRRALRP